MYSRWANFLVVVLWVATMTWLVKEKVLPPLLVGEPPDSQSILAAREVEPLVGWEACCSGEPIGWAISLTRSLPGESAEIRSRVHFERLPVGRLAPGWLRAILATLPAAPARIQADAQSRILMDAQGQLTRLESSVWFEPLREEVSMRGKVEGAHLVVAVRSGGLTYRTKVAIDPEALHGEALSPQTQLPGLHEGQTWTIDVCSPLGYPNSAVETLQARVVGQVRLHWHGRMQHVWLVEYHGNPGSRLSSAGEPRGRLWVRHDGAVLIQEVTLFSSKMKFIRMGDAEAAALAAKHGFHAGE